jgi:hypothetical protein
MENQDTDKSLFDLSFDENTKQQLKGAATWGGIAAIVAIIGAILSLINYFIQRNNVKSFQFEGFPEMRAQSSGNIVSSIVTFGLSIVLFYLLNKFSKSTKAGIDGSNQPMINEGLGSLSTYFKIIGVLLIIAIAFVCLALLIGIGTKV